MRLSPITAAFAIAWALLTAGIANAAIDGAPVENPVVRDGQILVAFREPIEQLGATVVGSDAGGTGVASTAGGELIRTRIGPPSAIFSGYSKQVTVAPVLIEHVEYVPVEILPEISNAPLTVASDSSAATVTGSDLAGVQEAASAVASQDPQGKVLFVWLWLLPASGVLSITAYLLVMAQMNRSWAAAAVRRGVAPKKVGFFV
jgi:hypothetical protein